MPGASDQELRELLFGLIRVAVEEFIAVGSKRLSPAAMAPPRPAARDAAREFVPNAVQKIILDALRAGPKRSTELGEIVGDRARVFRKPGGMQELRDQGLVDWHERRGYYLIAVPAVPAAGETAG